MSRVWTLDSRNLVLSSNFWQCVRVCHQNIAMTVDDTCNPQNEEEEFTVIIGHKKIKK